MSHNHSHVHGGDAAVRNISIAFLLNAFFVVVEAVGGVMTNSVAILSDALHDFGDCLSLLVARALQKKSGRGRDARYSYGYGRFSLLGSIFLSGVLSVSSIVVIVEAVKRIVNPEPVSASGMLWMAVFGIVVNGAAALRMKRGTSLNERAVYLHIMEDVLGWMGVLVVGVTMLFVDVPALDALLSLAISVWVLTNVYRNLKSVFRILLQGVPNGMSVDGVARELKAIPGVLGVHDLHIWSMDGEKHVMTLHVVAGGEMPVAEIHRRIVELAREHNITHTTIEFETPADICTTSCGL